jgi:WD40 repeat protein
MRKGFRNLAAKLGAVLLIVSARSMSAQGTPDIIWQGTHAGYVRYTAFSPDGQQLASGGDDRKNKLWQASDGTLLRTITHCSGLGCSGPTFGRYSPDSQQLARTEGRGLAWWSV